MDLRIWKPNSTLSLMYQDKKLHFGTLVTLKNLLKPPFKDFSKFQNLIKIRDPYLVQERLSMFTKTRFYFDKYLSLRKFPKIIMKM